jgi:hypothetical protein
MMADKQVHIMVDLETLGLVEDAMILSIGAVAFSAEGVDHLSAFYVEIDPNTSPGGVDISTIKFWFEQAVKTGKLPPVNGTTYFIAAVQQFRNWLIEQASQGELVLWANGTDFDIPKLCKAFMNAHILVPWKYNSVRDCRTVFKLFGHLIVDKPDKIDAHNARADAIWQAEYLMRILSEIDYDLN